MGLVSEFREFITKGSVFDLAVGVVIGAAFQKIVDSLVSDIIMPIIGIITGGINFSTLSLKVGEAELKYGNFIQQTIIFLLVAFVLFVFIRTYNRTKRKLAEVVSAEQKK
ncbi:MAG: large conductance mechanosensitive channel protein MscL [Bacteroidota bacterium]|jgi:large conductance mechanosensitive channel